MKLVSPTEHAIYATAFVARLHRESADYRRPSSFSIEEWHARASDLAVHGAEHAVQLHREAMRRRRS